MGSSGRQGRGPPGQVRASQFRNKQRVPFSRVSKPKVGEMLEFLLFGLIGVALGLRVRARVAIVLGIFVIVGIVAWAMVAHQALDARVLAVALAILGFNIGFVAGLALDRRRGQLRAVRIEGTPPPSAKGRRPRLKQSGLARDTPVHPDTPSR